MREDSEVVLQAVSQQGLALQFAEADDVLIRGTVDGQLLEKLKMIRLQFTPIYIYWYIYI